MKRDAHLDAPPPAPSDLAPHVIAVRLGHGANCSSIGSVVDTLFLSAVAGSAIFVAVMAALAKEPVRVHDEDEA